MKNFVFEHWIGPWNYEQIYVIWKDVHPEIDDILQHEKDIGYCGNPDRYRKFWGKNNTVVCGIWNDLEERYEERRYDIVNVYNLAEDAWDSEVIISGNNMLLSKEDWIDWWIWGKMNQ